MDKNVRYLLIVGGIIVLILIAVSVYKNFQTDKATPPPSTQSPSFNEETNKSQTHLDLPENISVPEQNQLTGQDVAAPVNVSPTSPQSNRSLRRFEIKAEGNVFKPKEIIVYVGDITQIKVTAVDKDYDWVQPDYGFNVKIPKGATKPIEFQATTPGKFIFYCESCGGLESAAVGYITVVPKQ